MRLTNGVGRAMIPMLGKHRLVRPGILAGAVRGLLMLILLNAWATGPATAQAPDPQQYRIAAGDKIGVAVLGQPDLSGEATVDQNGNLRLPFTGDIPAASLTANEL